MNGIKTQKLILPLLVSILLSLIFNLKVGNQVNGLIYFLFSPISIPTNYLSEIYRQNLNFIRSIPTLSHDNKRLTLLNNSLLSQNQSLKEAIKDQDVLKNIISHQFQTVPIRLVGIGNTFTATTSKNIELIEPGMPVISGNVLLGFVDKVISPIVYIQPLTDEHSSGLKITLGNQSGTYQYKSRTPQVADIPSQEPISLDDPVFTLPTSTTPANLVIGKLVKILSAPSDPLQKAEVKLELDLKDSPPNLLIITKP